MAKRGRYKRITEKANAPDFLMEMANLRPSKTGLTSGTIYISTEVPGHTPRIKFYRERPGKETPSASISIANEPEIIVDSLGMTAMEKDEAFRFVRANVEQLLNIWANGNTWYTDEFQTAIASLLKI